MPGPRESATARNPSRRGAPLPTLTAPARLRAIALSIWERVLPDWDVEIVEVPRGSLGADLGRTNAIPEIRRAHIQIVPHLPGESEPETLGHELGHVLWWPVTSLLDHADPRTRALIEPIAERQGVAFASLSPAAAAGLARAARDLPAQIRARITPAAALAREGATMEIPLIIAALKAALSSADVGGAVQALVDELEALYGATAPAEAAAAPLAGETASAMMRRAVTSIQTALARRSAPVDMLGPKVLARLGAKSDAEGLMRLETLLAASTQVETLTAADELRQRKAIAAETMRRTGLGRIAFFADGADELLPVWTAGTLDDMMRTCAAIKAGGAPLARPRAAPDARDEAGLAQRAKASGMTIEARRASEQNVNRGRAAQET